MQDFFHSRSPISRTAIERLVRPVDLDGTGRTTMVPFEREVSWIRQSETTVVLRNTTGETVLKGFCTCNDFYGYMTSFPNAFEGMYDPIRSFGLTGNGFLRLDIDVTVEEIPVMPPAPGEAREFGRVKYVNTPKDWDFADLVGAWDAATIEEKVTSVPSPRVGSRQVFSARPWTSHMLGAPVGEQLAAIFAALAPAFSGDIPETWRKNVAEELDRALSYVALDVADQAKAGV